MKQDNVQPEMYQINVKPGTDGGQVRIVIDGEEQVADGFEFAAPVGTGFAVKRIVRMELVPTNRDRRDDEPPVKFGQVWDR